jgi:hypothetical protein
MNVVLFTNWTDKKFSFPEDENAKWDGQPFSIEPGESKWLEDFKAQKFAKDIAERELNRESKPHIPVVIEELKAKCFKETIQMGESVSPAEAIAEQVAQEPEVKTKAKKATKKEEVKAEEEFEGLKD